MEFAFIFILVVMFLLAVTDLVVGVSNDAVNFLNSAIGSKAGSFKRIMFIASIGILFGSVFSSGMMEVARKGVFNPGFFTIEEIMYLFAAVMLTDIVLLDFYNTIALPTSTTVSIVFELLGAALAVSFFSVLSKDESISHWGQYINGSRALIIIVGIFLSVAVAFILGWVVQYITRLIVSFEYKKTMRSFGSIFGAASVALITLFIVEKGLKGIPFLPKETLELIKAKSGLICLLVGLISFILFQVLISRKGFSVYRFVTLLGTFALAMAFASNDLVNFIGVPIATFDSYFHWKGLGLPAEGYTMEVLSEPVTTNPIYLVTAGIIMIVTLWFSKKARSVVQTSVSLGRQDEGVERFKANELSRSLVKTVEAISEAVASVFPQTFRDRMAQRFIDNNDIDYEDPVDKPAFDIVRAAVNLIVSAGIILGATSLKLPLSTTFVSFMVLMGTSLADRSWAQGSAVYRVAGVLTVIGGWFLTAIIGLTVSIIFASLLINFKVYALIALVIIAILVIFKSYIFYRHHRYQTEVNIELADKWFKSDFMQIESEIRQKLTFILERLDNAFGQVIDGLITYDRHALSDLCRIIDDIDDTNALYKVKLTQQIKDVPEECQEGGKVLMLVYEMEDQLLYDLANIVRKSELHVSNMHPKLQPEQEDILLKIKGEVTRFMDQIIEKLKQDTIDETDYKRFKEIRKGLIKHIDSGISKQISLATSKKLSGKNSELLLTLMFSAKDIVLGSSSMMKLFYKVKTTTDLSSMLEKIVGDE